MIAKEKTTLAPNDKYGRAVYLRRACTNALDRYVFNDPRSKDAHFFTFCSVVAGELTLKQQNKARLAANVTVHESDLSGGDWRHDHLNKDVFRRTL